MRAILPALLLLGPAIQAAETGAPPPLPRKKNTAVSLLPNGSHLHDVMLPRYDDQRRLSAVLKAAVMTLVSEHVIAGDDVTISFHNPDHSLRARVDMIYATLDQSSGWLKARDAVTIDGGRVHATGSGLIYQMEKAKGFLTGPAVTRIRALTETAMNRTPSPRPAAAVVGAALLASAAAAPPAALTEQEKSAIAADATPAAPAHAEAATAARANLRAELAVAAKATADAAEFVEQAGLSTTQEEEPAAPAAPLEVPTGAQDTVISCDGGMYFDADAGVLVYLKNVRVNDPRFELSGANELKIFLAKKEGESEQKTGDKTGEKTAGPGFGAGFGDVERIVATGAVRLLQKQPEAGKEPVEASGAIFTYHPESGEIVLTGGYPWVKQGNSFMRAREPNVNLRIYRSGSFVTEGDWDMGGRLNQNP